MATPLEVIIEINNIGAMINYIPFILNFKYWYQTRIRDYLNISLFFLLSIVTNYTTSWTIWDNESTYRVFTFFYFMTSFIILTVASRAKWETPPTWAKMVIYSPVVSLIIFALLPGSLWFRHWWIGQAFFNPIAMIYDLFCLCCFASTRVEIPQNSKAKWTRIMWVLYFVVRIYQNFIFWTLGVLASNAIENFDASMLLLITINDLFSESLLLLMHIFFPQAVLITHEQLVRAVKVYKSINKYENRVLDIGIGNILGYLNDARQKLPDLVSD